MKIRRFTDIEKEALILNESFDFSDDNDGIDDSVESAKMISTFEDLCWKLLDSFYQFISVHYGDPEWFKENHFSLEYFLLDDDKLPLVDSEVYLSKSFDTRKLHFAGKLGDTRLDKSRVVIFDIPLTINAKNEFLSYNKMMQLLDDARTSRDYKIILKWVGDSNKSTFYPWSVEEGKKNPQCIKEYVGFCNDYINTFVEASKTPYKDIDKVRDLEGYKKKFTDLLYNFFTWLDINGKCPKPIGRKRGRFKFDFKEYGIPHMALLGSNIFFTKNTSVAELDSLDTMIHVNALANPRDYWAEALKGLGKFDFSWAQVCLEGGSVDIFYEIGEALEKFLENEKAKLIPLKESFDFDGDSDNINSSIEKIKASRILVDFLDEMEDDSVRMHPDEAIRKLNAFVKAYSNGGYQVELKYDENDNESHGYWINIRKNALFKSFFILPNGSRLMKRYAGMENIARCAMWICACLFKEMNEEVLSKIEDYGKKYRFNPVFFDFESTKDRVSNKYFPYLKESFDFDDNDDGINSSIEKIKVSVGLLKRFNELFERYIREISWTDVDEIAKSLDEMFSASVYNKRFEVTVKEAPIKKFSHPMKYIVLKRLSDGKQYKSAYSKYDVDQFKWLPLHHFLHLMCIVGTCLFDGMPDWWKELVKRAQRSGWNLEGKDSIDTIYQSYFENQE